MRHIVLVFMALCLTISSCSLQKKDEANTPNADQGTYFSIRDYARDQWNIYKGQPLGVLKTVNVNGTVDSVLQSAMNMDLGYILSVFVASDISDPKFLGKYKFSKFSDATTSTINFYYEATDPDLFTRKLHIMADNVTFVVTSIYIETQKKSSLNTVNQKLFYQPAELISIQEYETSKVGETKKMIIDYKFI